VEPCELAHVPAPQSQHLADVARAYFPVGQMLVQLFELSCVVDPYRPAGQPVHKLAPEREYFPVGQVLVHQDFLTPVYLPPGQEVQEVIPFAPAYLPPGQFLHMLEFLYVPVLQWRWGVW